MCRFGRVSESIERQKVHLDLKILLARFVKNVKVRKLRAPKGGFRRENEAQVGVVGEASESTVRQKVH